VRSWHRLYARMEKRRVMLSNKCVILILAREFTSLTDDNARHPIARQVRQLLLSYFQFTESHASRADAPIRTRGTNLIRRPNE